jgi:hypothetical protein
MLESDITISWEDFDANYIPPEKEGPQLEIAAFEESDLNDQLDGLFGNVISTPWGPFRRDDRFAPFNFYENMKLAHFKGFSTFSFRDPDFVDLMNNTEGVSIFKCQDPYCVIFGKGKLYSWKEVKSNIETNIKGQLVTKVEPTESQQDLMVKELLGNQKSAAEGYVALVLENGKFFEAHPDQEDYQKVYDEIVEMAKLVEGPKLIRGGKCE